MFNVNFTLLKAPRRQFHIGKKKKLPVFLKVKNTTCSKIYRFVFKFSKEVPACVCMIH